MSLTLISCPDKIFQVFIHRKILLVGTYSPHFRLHQIIEIAVESIVNFQQRFVAVFQPQECIFHLLGGNIPVSIHDFVVVVVDFSRTPTTTAATACCAAILRPVIRPDSVSHKAGFTVNLQLNCEGLSPSW